MKPEKFINLKKKTFYILSFTWGLPLSVIGLIVCCALMAVGYRPKKYGHCYYIEIGKDWGGLEFGWFFLVNKNPSSFIKRHELGHGYQNACIFGWLMPILWLMSAARYLAKNLLKMDIDYYSWWYESDANDIGNAIMDSKAFFKWES